MYVLPRCTDPQTKEGVLVYSTDPEQAPKRLYHARFPIEFAYRDTKQYLGLNDGQARLPTEGSLSPFSLRHRKWHNFEAEIHKRMGARSAAGQNAANSGAGRCLNTDPDRTGTPDQTSKCVRTID